MTLEQAMINSEKKVTSLKSAKKKLKGEAKKNKRKIKSLEREKIELTNLLQKEKEASRFFNSEGYGRS